MYAIVNPADRSFGASPLVFAGFWVFFDVFSKICFFPGNWRGSAGTQVILTPRDGRIRAIRRTSKIHMAHLGHIILI